MTETFNYYQARAASTAVYPEAETGSIMALAYVGLGLGEAGEIQGKIKKLIRDSGGAITDEDRKEIAKELGDLLWYVSQASLEVGYTLQEVANMNLDKLADRAARNKLSGSGDNR